MGEPEPFDWKPEIDLVKGLSPRVGALLEYIRAARERSAARGSVFVATVSEASGLDPEVLAARLRDDEKFAALFETALDASVRSAYERKLVLLAHVVAQAADDTASIDGAQLVTATIRDLEPPHVRALTVLASYKLEHPDAAGVAGVIENMAGLRARGPGRGSGSSATLQAQMGISADMADAISATLERLGLIWNDPPGFNSWGITGYGHRILDHIRKADKRPDTGSS